MKRISLLIFIGFLTVSCKYDYKARTIDKITIKEFKIDSTSIRAIVPITEKAMLFVGSNGAIGFTADDGLTWTKETITYQDSIQPSFRSIASNGTNTFILSIGNPALLYKVTNDEKKLVYTESHPKVFYDAMAFFDKKNGIAIGDPTDNCTSIILTHDGGDTWQKVDCSELPVAADGEASFAASNTNIAIVKNTVWVVTGGTKSRVFKSADKGETWEVFETPIIQGKNTQGIYSVDFADELHGIIVGGDYSKPEENTANKAITNDGGKTWTLVADGKSPNYKSCVQYVPNTYGKEIFAVGKTGVSFSNDGGLTWKDVNSDAYYGIQFVNDKTAWLSGHQKIGKLVLN